MDPRTEAAEADQHENLVITMPFNNDLTFPVALDRRESIGSLRKRIAEAIGVDASRVLISRPTPMLRPSEIIGDVATDNRLQLVVRSSFDFERLRRLIEEDQYKPITGPEVSIEPPSGLSSPDLSSGNSAAFPWRAPVLSPQRATRPKNTLRIKLKPGCWLTFEAPNEFLHTGDALEMTPELYKYVLGFCSPAPAPVVAAPVPLGQQLRGLLWQAAGETWRQIDQMNRLGMFRDIILATLLLVGALHLRVKFWSHPVVVSLFFISVVAFYVYLVLRLAHFPENFHIDWVHLAGLPQVFIDAERPEDLLERIPAQYRDNESTDEEHVDRIVNAMRKHVSVFSGLKVLAVSLVPPLYQAWRTRTEAQLDMHRRAVRMAAKQAAERQKAGEKDPQTPAETPEPEPPAEAAEPETAREEYFRTPEPEAEEAEHGAEHGAPQAAPAPPAALEGPRFRAELHEDPRQNQAPF